jgi:hypothetical protein
MAQHDYNLANQSGASFRADLNNALSAIQSNNASTVTPSTTTAYMWYADSSAAVMKVRNGADSLWLNVFKVNTSTVAPYVVTSAGAQAVGSAIVQRTVVNKFQKAQRGNILDVAYASTVTLDMNLSNNFRVSALTGNLTIANPSAITAAVGQGGSIFLKQDGTGSRTVSFGSMWKFPGGTAPTASTTPSSRDRVDYKVENASTIDAVYSVGNG